MKMYHSHWHEYEDYRSEWRKIAERERLARLAAPDPERYLPGDVAWVVSAFKRLARWFAEGFGSPSQTTDTRYPVQRPQRDAA
jgi:hypothetical protein